MKRTVILILHNVRSCYNVGSALRTADGLGVKKVYLTGYTPYPTHKNDFRLPHLASKINRRITKASLGAERLVSWQHLTNVEAALKELRNKKYEITALEQTAESIELSQYKPDKKVALIVGSEVSGLPGELLKLVDNIVKIPMLGKKESFNVIVAATISIYHIQRYWS